MKKIKYLFVSLLVFCAIVGNVSVLHAATYKDTSTEKWEAGVGTTLMVYFYQYSEYWHKNKTHYATAMMNGAYSSKVKAVSGKWAIANSPGSWGGYKTNKSYYDYD